LIFNTLKFIENRYLLAKTISKKITQSLNLKIDSQTASNLRPKSLFKIVVLSLKALSQSPNSPLNHVTDGFFKAFFHDLKFKPMQKFLTFLSGFIFLFLTTSLPTNAENNPENLLNLRGNTTISSNCTAKAGTVYVHYNNLTLSNGSATIMGYNTNNSYVPSGYKIIYVLTKGDNLVIVDAKPTPHFTVREAGRYRVHVLVYNPHTLDLSIVKLGVTTGGQVNSLLIQGGGSICASLNVAGTQVHVYAPVCSAKAGTVHVAYNFVTLSGGSATISGYSTNNSTVPSGYQVIYVLTKGDNLVIVDAKPTPHFTVRDAGKYRIHVLVYNPHTLNLGIVKLGETTGGQVNSLLIQGGGSICASLNVAGTVVMVNAPATCTAKAGTVYLSGVVLSNGSVKITGHPTRDSHIPSGYQVIYVLTKGDNLVIIDAKPTPDFILTDAGTYRVHVLVYNPHTLNLGIVKFGVTTGGQVNSLLIQGGGSICASLNVTGTKVQIYYRSSHLVAASSPDVKMMNITLPVNQADIKKDISSIETADETFEMVEKQQVKTNSNRGTREVVAFPNPAKDFIDIDLSGYEGKPVAIFLYNAFGKIERTVNLNSAEKIPYRLEVGALTSGQYLVRVMSEGTNDAVRKVMIAR
jgi:hypothetical protein